MTSSYLDTNPPPFDPGRSHPVFAMIKVSPNASVPPSALVHNTLTNVGVASTSHKQVSQPADCVKFRSCLDCGDKHESGKPVNYANIVYGVFLCERCAKLHRKVLPGPHRSNLPETRCFVSKATCVCAIFRWDL